MYTFQMCDISGALILIRPKMEEMNPSVQKYKNEAPLDLRKWDISARQLSILVPEKFICCKRTGTGGMSMDKLKYHLQQANLYGTLAAIYEHKNPEKHCKYYRKHFYHEMKVKELYKKRKGHHGMDSSSSHGMYYHHRGC